MILDKGVFVSEIKRGKIDVPKFIMRDFGISDGDRVVVTIYKREVVLDEVPVRCVVCGSTEGLRNHHISYKPEIVVPVCIRCHNDPEKHKEYFAEESIKISVQTKTILDTVLRVLRLCSYDDAIEWLAKNKLILPKVVDVTLEERILEIMSNRKIISQPDLLKELRMKKCDRFYKVMESLIKRGVITKVSGREKLKKLGIDREYKTRGRYPVVYILTEDKKGIKNNENYETVNQDRTAERP